MGSKGTAGDSLGARLRGDFNILSRRPDLGLSGHRSHLVEAKQSAAGEAEVGLVEATSPPEVGAPPAADERAVSKLDGVQRGCSPDPPRRKCTSTTTPPPPTCTRV